MKHVNLYGIVLCGGRSSRMGVDKSLLNYHGIEQRYHVYEMLEQFCSRVFLSYSSESQIPPDTTRALICDSPAYAGHGPISGLLSAFSRFPSKGFLLIGCDYPFLQAGDMGVFLSSIPDDSVAAAFYNEQENCYEPVLAWYSPAAGTLLSKHFYDGNKSLQNFLKKINAFKAIPADPASLQSVDTYAEYSAATEQLLMKCKLHNP